MTNKTIFNKAIKKYGDKQIVVCIEELSELQKELCKYLRYDVFDKKTITEEIADVEIMLFQVKEIIGIKPADVEEVKDYKALRLEQRMRQEDFDAYDGQGGTI